MKSKILILALISVMLMAGVGLVSCSDEKGCPGNGNCQGGSDSPSLTICSNGNDCNAVANQNAAGLQKCDC